MNSIWNKLAACTLGIAVIALTPAAQAHGSTKPKHGGIVQIVGETSFELATKPAGAEVYLLDEGDEIASSGVEGRLNIVAPDGATSSVALAPAGGNKLVAPGVKIAKGSKVTVLLTDKTTQARTNAKFTIN